MRWNNNGIIVIYSVLFCYSDEEKEPQQIQGSGKA